MSDLPPSSADTLTFEDAIALTQALLAQMQQGTLSEDEIERAIATLVSTENGARGFFVIFLADDTSPADHPSDVIIRALQTSPEIVSELLVKNLAMATAMAIVHNRNDDEEMMAGSQRVRSRTAHLITLLQLPEVLQKAQQLHESAATGVGEYKLFLDRWNYDTEQRQCIRQVMEEIIQRGPTKP